MTAARTASQNRIMAINRAMRPPLRLTLQRELDEAFAPVARDRRKC